MDAHERLDAVKWLAEKEQEISQKEATRYGWMLGFTIIAAVGASIAAWPVVKEWLMK